MRFLMFESVSKVILKHEVLIFQQDGQGLSSTEVLTIRILDIQDTPPEFQGTPYIVTVLENMPMVGYKLE